MKTTGKKYKSVLAMVKDLSDPAFAKEFEKKLKKETVYVYSNMDDGEVEVFSSLKLAKQWAEQRLGEKVQWEGNTLRGVWQYEYAFIHRKKIIRC
jgi:epoxyqueuosine reductase QueG